MPQSITISRRTYVAIAIGITLIIIGITAVGCSAKFVEPFKDAPTTGHNGDPALVVEMPDGFSNFATKCIAKGIRAATTYHGDKAYGAITLINDPHCK